jgi:predicted adenylyl cyclase CyaB
MVFEVELKACLTDPATVETRAGELGVFKGETTKLDIYFRRCGDSSRLPADRFRLRREGRQAVVNFKQEQQADGLEVNQEIEFEVSDAHAFYQFADRFGFEPFVVKRKQARIYQIGQAQVELNQVEHLGHFVEIEILCEQENEVPVARVEVARLLTRLGLEAAAVEPRPYIELLQEVWPVRYRFVDDRLQPWPFVEMVE